LQITYTFVALNLKSCSMYSERTYNVMEKIFNGLVWSIPTDNKSIFITFDDGPIPEVTPWVLDTLKRFDAKATFFCLGKNVESNPEIYQRILTEGHAVGNHTHNHVDGWKIGKRRYVANINKCSEWVDSRLFRPPYGRLLPAHYKMIKNNYSVVMWNVLCGDFDKRLTGERCVDNVILNTKPGSIILFHDSVKANDRLRYALPRVLKYYAEKNYSFKPIVNGF